MPVHLFLADNSNKLRLLKLEAYNFILRRFQPNVKRKLRLKMLQTLINFKS